MSEIKIEKGIPIPKAFKQGATKYPWRSMEVGDSFLIPRINGEPIATTIGRASNIAHFAKKSGVTLTRRREGEAGVRVWRTA